MSNAYNYYSNRSNRSNSNAKSDQEYLKDLEQRRKTRLNQEQQRFHSGNNNNNNNSNNNRQDERKKVELEAKKKDEALSLVAKLKSWSLQDVILQDMTNCGDPDDVYDSEIDALEITPSLTFDEEDEHLGLNVAPSKTFDWDEDKPKPNKQDSERTHKAGGFLLKRRQSSREDKALRALKDVSCNQQRIVPQMKK